MPKGCEQILKKIDQPIAMAEFGAKQVKDYYNLDTEYIPLGTEPERFYRLPDEQRNAIRVKWNLADKFVVGVVARNQPRKFLDRTIKAFRFLADKVPNAVFIIAYRSKRPSSSLENE